MEMWKNIPVGRNELLKWVNDSVGMKLTKIEELRDGLAYFLIFDAVFHSKLPIHKLIQSPRLKEDCVRNFQLIGDIMQRKKVPYRIHPERLALGKFSDHLEFLQWLYSYVNRFHPLVIAEYNSMDRRKKGLSKNKRKSLNRSYSKRESMNKTFDSQKDLDKLLKEFPYAEEYNEKIHSIRDPDVEYEKHDTILNYVLDKDKSPLQHRSKKSTKSKNSSPRSSKHTLRSRNLKRPSSVIRKSSPIVRRSPRRRPSSSIRRQGSPILRQGHNVRNPSSSRPKSALIRSHKSFKKDTRRESLSNAVGNVSMKKSTKKEITGEYRQNKKTQSKNDVNLPERIRAIQRSHLLHENNYTFEEYDNLSPARISEKKETTTPKFKQSRKRKPNDLEKEVVEVVEPTFSPIRPIKRQKYAQFPINDDTPNTPQSRQSTESHSISNTPPHQDSDSKFHHKASSPDDAIQEIFPTSSENASKSSLGTQTELTSHLESLCDTLEDQLQEKLLENSNSYSEIEDLRSERDKYFHHLRGVEMLCQGKSGDVVAANILRLIQDNSSDFFMD